MKSITETLQEIACSDSYLDDGATFYVVIDDHRRDDEPQVMRMQMSDEQLARSNDRRIIESVIEHSLQTVLSYWRGGDE